MRFLKILLLWANLLPGGFSQFENLFPGETSAIDHVVNMSVSVTYHVRAPAILSLKVRVPYVTSTSVSSEGYSFCPTAYLIDFAPPVSSEKYTAGATRDRLGMPKTSCAAYDFIYDPKAFDFPDTGGSQTYPNPPQPLDCGRPSHAWYCNTPVAWTRVVDQTSGTVDYLSNVTTAHIADYDRSCRSLEDDRRVMKIERRFLNLSLPNMTETGVSNPSPSSPFAVEVETYTWDLYVCAVGPHGPGCRAEEYGFTCKRFPARFDGDARYISAVMTTSVGCAYTNASVTFVEAFPTMDVECSAGWERLRLFFNLENFFGSNENTTLTMVHPSGFKGSKVTFNASTVEVTTPCANTGRVDDDRYNPRAFLEIANARDGGVGFEFFVMVDEGNHSPCNYTVVVTVGEDEVVFKTPFPPEAVESPSASATMTGIGTAATASGAVAVAGVAAWSFSGSFATPAACQTCAYPGAAASTATAGGSVA